jgi:hypothetical protein
MYNLFGNKYDLLIQELEIPFKMPYFWCCNDFKYITPPSQSECNIVIEYRERKVKKVNLSLCLIN